MFLIIDPNKKYKQADPDALRDAMGILPLWVDDQDPRPAKEQFEEKYQFGCFPMTGGTVDEEGTFWYPGDPPMPPIGKIERSQETVYFYQYAIVATVQKDEDRTLFMTRMD